MTDYRNRKNGEIITNLRLYFPNVSIPDQLNQSDYDALDIDPIQNGVEPQPGLFQSVERYGPEKNAEGQWVWQYRLVDWTPEQIAVATDAKWNEVIRERDKKLSNSDWTQLPDVPLTPEQVSAWRAYRQQLRDVTQQTDPFNIVWPTPPESNAL